MLKVLGAVLMIVAGALAGFGESHKLVAREQSLCAALRFISAARAEICYAALPVEQLLKKHGTLPFMGVCAAACRAGEDFPSAWRAALKNAKRLCLDKQDLALMLDFGLGLGASDTDGQLAHCALYEKLLEARHALAREERSRKLQLYRGLGVFTGAAVALVLC